MKEIKKRNVKKIKKQLTESFKKLFMELFDAFPNVLIREDKIKNVIISGKDRVAFVKQNYLKRTQVKGRSNSPVFYSLGPNALSLISSWKTEELNKDIRRMTWWLWFLTALIVVIGAFQLYFTMKPCL